VERKFYAGFFIIPEKNKAQEFLPALLVRPRKKAKSIHDMRLTIYGSSGAMITPGRIWTAGDRARHGRRFPRPRGKPGRTGKFQTFASVMLVNKLMNIYEDASRSRGSVNFKKLSGC